MIDTADGITKATPGDSHANLQKDGVSSFSPLPFTSSASDALPCIIDSPRVILIEQYGTLVGLITIKDCLKYNLAQEASEGQQANDNGAEAVEQTLEEIKIWFEEVGRSILARVTGKRSPRGEVELEMENESTEEED